MRSYETTFILQPGLDADGVTREVGSLKEFIKSHGGEVTVEKEWGRRKLAFPIKDQSEGTYYVFRFHLGNEGLKELDRWFRLNENVLRHLVIRDEGTPLDYLSPQSESDERTRDFSERRYSRSAGERGATPSRAPAASKDAAPAERTAEGGEKPPAERAPESGERPPAERAPGSGEQAAAKAAGESGEPKERRTSETATPGGEESAK
jgi:small subunit ribosomal protein S6